MFSQDVLHPHNELHPLPFSMQEHEVFEHPFAQLHFFISLESRFSSLDIVRSIQFSIYSLSTVINGTIWYSTDNQLDYLEAILHFTVYVYDPSLVNISFSFISKYRTKCSI